MTPKAASLTRSNALAHDLEGLNSMYLLWILLALTSSHNLPLPLGPADCPKNGQAGQYSKYSIQLCFQNPDTGRRLLDILSPNRSVRFSVNGTEGQFYVRGQAVGGHFTVPVDEEIIWSPDSRAVITTISFGASGPTSAGVGYVDQKARPDIPAVTPMIQRSFAARHPKELLNKCSMFCV